MANDDVYRCHVALQIPTNPKFGSLNLASAVQLIAYEWRQILGFNGDEAPINPQTNPQVNSDQSIEKLADAKQIADLLTHWEESLVHIGYLDPLKPRKLMPRLQQLFNRAKLRDEEIHILRGVAKAILKQDT
jgi:tRNA/rRNA methyltransferase